MKTQSISSRFQRSGRQRGVTLVELLVALVMGLGVLVGVSAVYIAAKQAFRFQETAGRLQEDATFALDTIARDLRMAGFAGCRGIDSVTISSVLTYFPILSLSASAPGGIDGPNPLATVEPGNPMVTMQPLSPQNFLRGFDSNVPAAMFSTAPTSGTTDSLFFSGGSASGVSLTAAMATANANLTIGADPFKWGNTTTNSGVYHMIVSDCATSSLFAGKIASSGSQISHAAALGNLADTFAPSDPLYDIDALVMPLEWSFFYVATRPGARTPSLYRVFYDGNSRKSAEEIVSNVETMKLNYGENLFGIDSVTSTQCTLASAGATCSPTMQADSWRTTASAVTDWSRVVAVRVGLMMVGADDNATQDVVAVVPTLLGVSYTLPTGASSTRLRKEFSTTVVLRNRILSR